MFGKSRARVVGMAGAAVLSGAVIAGTSFVGVDSAGAAQPRTIMVTFGDSGASPETVQLHAGDSIMYVNKVTQSGSLPLSGLTAQVQSAAVDVTGAATQAISLPRYSSSVTVTYPSAGTVKYTATYTYRLLPLLNALGINLVPSTATKPHAGTLAIAAAPAQQPAQSGGGQQQPAAPGGGSNAGAPPAQQQPAQHAPAQQQGTVPQGQAPNPYTPQGPSVADRTVPHGTGSGNAGGATDARPQAPLGAQPPAALPDLPSDGSQTVLTGSVPNAGLGVPAILAIVLLSVVTAALVRALITQRRTAVI